MNPKLFTVSAPPHWHSGRTIPGTMYTMLLALLPAAVMGIVYFGVGAARVLALSSFTAVVVQALSQKLQKRPLTVYDGSALLTGVLLAFLLPASAPWWMVILGVAAALVVGREVFGGLGGNPLPAACVGWAILKISWPVHMDFDQSMLASTLVNPLTTIRMFGHDAAANFNFTDLMLGVQLGGIGAVSGLALFAGGVFLVARGILKPQIPTAFLLGVFGAAAAFDVNAVFHLLTGSVLLGAFFLATDFSSSPVNHWPMIIFGLIAGALVMVIRMWGIYPDGVPFAVLLTCLVAPLLDRITPRAWGKR